MKCLCGKPATRSEKGEPFCEGCYLENTKYVIRLSNRPHKPPVKKFKSQHSR